MHPRNNGHLKRPIGRPPLQQGEVTISRGVRLLARDWALVKKVAKFQGSRGVSAGLREMVKFYRLYHPVIEPQPIQHKQRR